MTYKQIIIDYKNLCENYSKEVGCFGTFDGSCIKEQCFTYKLLQQLQAKEQECETLASQLDFEVQKKECLEQECERLKNIIETKLEDANICDSALNYINDEYIYAKRKLAQLKAEVKSKTEYIQEQREIIDQYSKEIEMYKKCQGKRASKREDQLKADNKHLNDLLNQALKELEQSREAIEKIKEIANKMEYGNDFDYDFTWGEQILQICDEVENENNA